MLENFQNIFKFVKHIYKKTEPKFKMYQFMFKIFQQTFILKIST